MFTYKGQEMKYEQAVKFMLYKISEDGAHPVPLDALTDWHTPEEVPEARRAQLLRDLKAEATAREIMGDETYFATASLIGKVTAYEAAMDEIIGQHTADGTREMRLTWAEFKRWISREIEHMQAAKEEEPEQVHMQGWSKFTGGLQK